ncbi:hypothetical protein [Burkholderia stagnalis]|uniref:hypothetical protein n=1 Tax=Burkholderia stagnalis TaxID=1503054 RepID=UPI0012DA9CC9|nr:hypothetical protein [Burkholderia stagnalis]
MMQSLVSPLPYNHAIARSRLAGDIAKVIRQSGALLLLIKYIINSNRAPQTAARFGIQLPETFRFHR